MSRKWFQFGPKPKQLITSHSVPLYSLSSAGQSASSVFRVPPRAPSCCSARPGTPPQEGAPEAPRPLHALAAGSPACGAAVALLTVEMNLIDGSRNTG